MLVQKLNKSLHVGPALRRDQINLGSELGELMIGAKIAWKR
jgi:hypothetical protein